MNIRKIISRRKLALKTASPKLRDKARHELKVALIVAQLRKENAA
jgi:hypothetical protein